MCASEDRLGFWMTSPDSLDPFPGLIYRHYSCFVKETSALVCLSTLEAKIIMRNTL